MCLSSTEYKKIRENTSVDQCKYVESKQNTHFINDGREGHEVQENDPEVKRSVAMATTVSTQIAQ